GGLWALRRVNPGGGVPAVAFHPDGQRLATAGGDGMVKIWEVKTGRPAGTYRGHTRSVRSLAFSPDGELLASGGEDRTVILRDSASGREVRPPFLGHSCWVHGVAFSRDGELLSSASGLGPDSLPAARVASVSGDGNVKLWDVATGREVVTIHGHGSFVRCVAFHPDGSRLVTASADGTIKLWDAASGQEVLALRGHDGGVF